MFMFKKFSTIFIIFITLIMVVGCPSYAEEILNWSVGVETPVHYTTLFSSGEHGIVIEGFQKNIDKGGKIRYEIVNSGFWKDKILDDIEINNNGNFSAILKVPRRQLFETSRRKNCVK
ncbi:hypothetical protein [Neobacillus mesonae]|uniref:hypothetical protein n=1 Tax=Neobacillus mesonae TaxID=1193713 RepID=UPI00203D1A67|nr:hypothetical protein [Neobacillus mesonae]MCM3569482.1 hypothetical protein [Neobacillus mesonae]